MTVDENWFSRGKAEAEKGIPHSERVTSIAITVFSVLMVVVFVAHQRRSTGFFTEEFGTVETLMLYGVCVFWIISAGLEGVLGRRLLSRIVDAFGGVILSGVGIVWLLVVFPFEFDFFAEVLPESFRFLAQWISNDVARLLMGLGIMVHLVGAIYGPIAYKFVDTSRFKRATGSD